MLRTDRSSVSNMKKNTLQPTSRETLATAIADQEALLGALDRQREQMQARIEDLRRQLAEVDSSSEAVREAIPLATQSSAMTPAAKIGLFRSLFRGRDDVYPKRWENRRTGKKGYAPACAHEWVRGVCEKPRVKCGECPNQAFLSVTDPIVLDHLQGRHVIGAYPLLEDETCWFLAVDFDKRSWAEDVTAFADTCRTSGISVAVERGANLRLRRS
jgi:hypothetical protein